MRGSMRSERVRATGGSVPPPCSSRSAITIVDRSPESSTASRRSWNAFSLSSSRYTLSGRSSSAMTMILRGPSAARQGRSGRHDGRRDLLCLHSARVDLELLELDLCDVELGAVQFLVEVVRVVDVVRVVGAAVFVGDAEQPIDARIVEVVVRGRLLGERTEQLFEHMLGHVLGRGWVRFAHTCTPPCCSTTGRSSKPTSFTSLRRATRPWLASTWLRTCSITARTSAAVAVSVGLDEVGVLLAHEGPADAQAAQAQLVDQERSGKLAGDRVDEHRAGVLTTGLVSPGASGRSR
jgi:hypothetical protein